MDISIRTAQHVNIVYQPAGLVNRIGATLIDLAFLGGIYILCFTLASLSSIFRNTTTAIILLVILMCYHFVCEYFFHGRSLGKLTLHLRVVRLDGRKLSFWNCLLRWILRLVDISASMGILAMLSIIISSKMQRLGDLAAGTTVNSLILADKGSRSLYSLFFSNSRNTSRTMAMSLSESIAIWGKVGW